MQLCQKFLVSCTFNEIKDHPNTTPAEKQILMFLWYAGHEACSFRDVGDRFNLALSTVHEIIKRITTFISNMAESVIIWPNNSGKAATAAYFYQKKGFPGVIGAIDGTHIQIDPPKEGSDDYINRKGYHSVVLQGITNEHNKFIDIFVGFPGATHDARVFRSSPIFNKLSDTYDKYYLIGDSAYPCLKWCITPYRDNGHLNIAQKYFNTRLSSTRICIEHCFGLLKQRFRQLYYLKLKGQERICHFVTACCVLHNICDDDDIITINLFKYLL